jgi:DNA replication protein DnaC
MTRARDRIQQALSRLGTGLQTLDSKLLQHVSSVVERTAVDVGDTKAGVERTEKGIHLTRAGVDQLYERENVKDQTMERQRIIDWICPSEIDYIDQQNALTNMRQQGIGEWFVETREFKSWVQGDRATLLCSGKPGAGKTMTTSFVVNSALETHDNDNQTGVAYIYCQYPRHKEQTPEYLVSSILRQLLE